MDKASKPIDSECSTPSSDPFRFSFILNLSAYMAIFRCVGYFINLIYMLFASCCVRSMGGSNMAVTGLKKCEYDRRDPSH
jgi:hypothetical protein